MLRSNLPKLSSSAGFSYVIGVVFLLLCLMPKRMMTQLPYDQFRALQKRDTLYCAVGVSVMLHIKAAKYLSGFKLWIAFDDGTEGAIDLDGVLNGPVFEPLRDLNTFKKVAVDPELETVVWPNGADMAPEFLKQLHKQQLQQ
jgi:hypothetical protein